ncbi:ECF transporter S component [Lentilactobacillus raoultii]|uniref:ECF transporter S component n=1 Tax=Lentilactobacillus raoultii TaxID=1987503 RepID=A0ABW3PG36_9LACO|nr:ECF transporter S component [Lentilactobacillus raoultii]
MKKKFHLQDIILIALIAIAFGAIFVGTDWLYNFLYLAIGPFANEALFGLWIMAGPLTMYLVRVPGSAVIGETLGAAAEVLFGGTFGAAALISGIVQGVGSELGFALLRYRNWGWASLLSSSITTTIVAFGYELFRLGYVKYSIPMIIALFLVRLVSDLVFGTVLVKMIFALVERSSVLHFDVSK